MKICLISPPSPFLINDKVFPALGIFYIAGVLRAFGEEVEIYDCGGKPEIQWSDELSQKKCDYFGISTTTPQYASAEKVADAIKSANKDSTTIIGGPHISSGNSYNEKLFDIAVHGDGEIAMLDIIKGKLKNGFISGRMINTLDDIPLPARDMVSLKDYKYYIADRLATHMVTSRGCPYSCAFCCQWNHAKKVRLHSADYVIREIKQVESFGYKSIMFFDDIFILNRRRLFKITEYLKSADIKFRCFVRSDMATEEVVANLADAGCYEIGFGAESGSQKILDNINKCSTVEQNERLVSLCHKYNIRIKAFIVVGLPGENKETLKETEGFLERSNLDDVDIGMLSVFKGSDIEKNPDKYDVKFDATGLFWKGTPGKYESHVMTSCLSSAEILEARNRFESKFKKKEFLR